MRIGKRFVFICLVLFGAFFVFVVSRVEKAELKPSISCTKIFCPPMHPCCNTCRHDGWNTVDNLHRARALFFRLPVYQADGCGRIEGAGKCTAYGLLVSGDFWVLKWEQLHLHMEKS